MAEKSHDNGHHHHYFAEVHASKESQFFGAAHNIADTTEITALKKRLETESGNYELLLKTASALNDQLRYRESIELYNRAIALRPDDPAGYRQRGPRLLNTLQFDRAYADFAFCEQKDSGTMDIAYRLGMALYMMARYPEAESWFAKSIQYSEAENNTEMVIASLYWRIFAQIQLSPQSQTKPTFGPWLNFDFSRDVGHHEAYRDVVKLFCDSFGPAGIVPGGTPSGGLSASVRDTLLNAAAALYRLPDPNGGLTEALSTSMLNYGVYGFYRYLGEQEKAAQALKTVIDNDHFWICYAYLAAWTDYTRK
ncbi:hypothetical protein FACS1894151_08990 [Spirochaetia bacterium]|nr:hypothetical protein FACS1894151_08990 [Spirochaetia bacterium]